MEHVGYFDVLGVRISAVNLGKAWGVIDHMIQKKQKGYICVAPVSTIVDCYRNSDYRRIVNQAAMVTPDGMPVVWLGRRRFGPEVERTYGPDLMLKVCGEGQAKQYRHFFYGGTPEVCDRLVHYFKEKFPDINIVGAISPPFMPKAERLTEDAVRQINRSLPDIIWVGLGSPKQDFWMALNRDILEASVIIGIGAAFDFHAGVKPQAPKWMQRNGLEWLFRLLCEPRRLWKRYLIGNTLFVWWLLTEKFNKRTS